MTPAEVAARRRPRVADDREGEILDATVHVVGRLGYERLTMDLVAAAARASKATLYRHWSTKAELVVDAVMRAKQMPDDQETDTGTLRGDLLASWCGHNGWAAEVPMAVMAGLMGSLRTDPELAAAFHERFLHPRQQHAREMFARAIDRDEARPDVDVETVMAILPALCLHREMLLGQPIDDTYVQHVIDDVLLPACQPPPRATVT